MAEIVAGWIKMFTNIGNTDSTIEINNVLNLEEK